MRHLRFTGAFPPIDVLEQLPNWESALDEEEVEGQDETTIRPAEDQGALSSETCFTAGSVHCADGTRLPAILEVAMGEMTALTVYESPDWTWSLSLLGKPGQWQPLTWDWLPEEERPPSVKLDDPAIFPLRVESRLAWPDGTRLVATIERTDR